MKIICPNPNCGFKGFAKRKSRGNILIGLILLVLLFPIGIIYLIFKSGYRYQCPRCGLEITAER